MNNQFHVRSQKGVPAMLAEPFFQITNPDLPEVDEAFSVQVTGDDTWAVSIAITNLSFLAQDYDAMDWIAAAGRNWFYQSDAFRLRFPEVAAAVDRQLTDDRCQVLIVRAEIDADGTLRSASVEQRQLSEIVTTAAGELPERLLNPCHHDHTALNGLYRVARLVAAQRQASVMGLDADGLPLPTLAAFIVRELTILANYAVAWFCQERAIPALYRYPAGHATKPTRHTDLNLASYVPVTSATARADRILNQYQLLATLDPSALRPAMTVVGMAAIIASWSKLHQARPSQPPGPKKKKKSTRSKQSPAPPSPSQAVLAISSTTEAPPEGLLADLPQLSPKALAHLLCRTSRTAPAWQALRTAVVDSLSTKPHQVANVLEAALPFCSGTSLARELVPATGTLKIGRLVLHRKAQSPLVSRPVVHESQKVLQRLARLDLIRQLAGCSTPPSDDETQRDRLLLRYLKVRAGKPSSPRDVMAVYLVFREMTGQGDPAFKTVSQTVDALELFTSVARVTVGKQVVTSDERFGLTQGEAEAAALHHLIHRLVDHYVVTGLPELAAVS